MISRDKWLRMTPKQQWDTFNASQNAQAHQAWLTRAGMSGLVDATASGWSDVEDVVVRAFTTIKDEQAQQIVLDTELETDSTSDEQL